MKAVVCAKFGPPESLQLQEVEKPTLKDSDVLVRIRASSVNFNILAYMEGKPVFARLMGV